MRQKVYYTGGELPVIVAHEASGRYDIHYGYGEDADGKYCYEEQYRRNVFIEDVRDCVEAFINDTTISNINHFDYNGDTYWLSTENQQNYKTIYDLLVQGVDVLPITLRTYNDGVGANKVFTADDFRAFYLAMHAHISNCIKDGWRKKDTFDYSPYEALI